MTVPGAAASRGSRRYGAAVSGDTPVQVFADDERVEVLAAYTDGLDDLVQVCRDATAAGEDVIDRAPAPGAWSVAQVVHHLTDYELAHALALRRTLVEDAPRLAGWDQDAYADRLGYDVRPPEDALTVLLALRYLNARLLAAASPDAWTRTVVAADGTATDLAGLARAASDHLRSHVLQARRAVVGLT